MKTRVVVIFPEIEDVTAITELRRRFDPLAELVPPHITLAFPFASDHSTEDIASHISNMLADVAPFRVRFSGITGNEGEYLFLNVKEGNDQVIALHDQLYKGILQPYLSAEHTYLPHMTVGRLSDKSAWTSALSEVSSTETSYTTIVREIAVYSIEETGKRTIEFVFPFPIQ